MVVTVVVLAASFLTALAAKERDNRFCVSCHLHDEKLSRLIAARSRDLAGWHHAKKPEVGCIGCHGGADLRMRLVVWTIAGVDTVRFLAGRYAEPTHMRLPLRDAECRQCHTPILAPTAATPRPGGPTAASASADPTDESAIATEAETEGRSGTSYHAIREHLTIRIACVRCHTSHTTDSEPANRFLSRDRVRSICRECHKTM